MGIEYYRLEWGKPVRLLSGAKTLYARQEWTAHAGGWIMPRSRTTAAPRNENRQLRTIDVSSQRH